MYNSSRLFFKNNLLATDMIRHRFFELYAHKSNIGIHLTYVFKVVFMLAKKVIILDSTNYILYMIKTDGGISSKTKQYVPPTNGSIKAMARLS